MDTEDKGFAAIVAIVWGQAAIQAWVYWLTGWQLPF
jgi:hypothetical protein